ncbi:acyltransferase [Pseudonocardia sp. H11422]|uniref:acyltransferase n=1 Tax=Pseudonocardia sp. H11422 TaxID=2835866 RepID=UPI001BDCE6A6|nr:acyltransferase [Pseudonocardia sp. H11422]
MTTAAERTATGTPEAPQAGGELRALTGLRIVAAVWVMLFHFHFTALPGVADVVGTVGPLLTAGALGVDLFFVLSGFVIAYTYLEKMGPALRAGSAARFVWARACRLWPAYVVVFNLFGLWIGARLIFGNDDQVAFQGVQPVVSVGAWLEQLFMVHLWDHAYFDGASWVGSTWSISAEWLAYVLFPVAAVAFYRLRNAPRPLLALGALALMGPIAWAYLSTGSPYFPWSWTVRILCGFGAGVLTYLVVRRTAATPRVRRAASLTATTTPFLIAAGLCLGELAGPGRGGAVITLFPVLVGSLALADRGAARVLSTGWAVHGGRVSYSLYLVHIPIFEVYWLAMVYVPALWQPTVTAHVIGAAVVFVTFPVAHLLHRWIEEPARLRMRGWFGARRPSPAAVADPDSDPVTRALRTIAMGAVAPAPRSVAATVLRPHPAQAWAAVQAAPGSGARSGADRAWAAAQAVAATRAAAAGRPAQAAVCDPAVLFTPSSRRRPAAVTEEQARNLVPPAPRDPRRATTGVPTPTFATAIARRRPSKAGSAAWRTRPGSRPAADPVPVSGTPPPLAAHRRPRR